MPAGARPGRGNARAARPRPCSPPRPPAPPRLWRAEPRAPLAAAAADVAPAAPRSQQCRAGKTKGIRFASFPASHLHSRGAARDPGPTGAAPPGAPSHARPDLSPPTPASPLPPPPARLTGARPAAPRYARTPGPQGSGRIVPAARSALVQDRQLPPRAYPPGSRSKPGAPRKPSPDAAAAALWTPLRSGFFFPFFFQS